MFSNFYWFIISLNIFYIFYLINYILYATVSLQYAVALVQYNVKFLYVSLFLCAFAITYRFIKYTLSINFLVYILLMILVGLTYVINFSPNILFILLLTLSTFSLFFDLNWILRFFLIESISLSIGFYFLLMLALRQCTTKMISIVKWIVFYFFINFSTYLILLFISIYYLIYIDFSLVRVDDFNSGEGKSIDIIFLFYLFFLLKLGLSSFMVGKIFYYLSSSDYIFLWFIFSIKYFFLPLIIFSEVVLFSSSFNIFFFFFFILFIIFWGYFLLQIRTLREFLWCSSSLFLYLPSAVFFF